MAVFKIIFSFLSFALGASFGSFAGLVGYRISKNMSIIKPDSYCSHCKSHIKPYDNIPVISWIILGGKCRYCKSQIGIFPLILEIFGGLSLMLSYLQYGDRYEDLPIFIALIFLVFLCLIISAIDYETHDIYNITLVIFAMLSIFISTYRIVVFKSNLWNYISGAMLGFLFFLLIKIISKRLLKKDALGTGDVYIVGIGGLLLGVFPLLISIIIATILGLVIELLKSKGVKNKMNIEIAFGPYLLLGIGLMAIYGEKFMNFYWEVMINAFV